MTTHLGTRALFQLAEGLKSDARARSHVRTCRACAAERDWIARALEYVRRPAPPPPAAVVARAWALMPPRLPSTRERLAFHAAQLVGDQGRSEAATGALRASGRARHLIWRARGVDVDVLIESDGLGATAALAGQMIPHEGESSVTEGLALLSEGSRLTHWAPVLASGEFTLPAPSKRHWALWLEWGRFRVCLSA